MSTDRDGHRQEHLDEEELELFLSPGPAAEPAEPPERLRDHLGRCAQCRDELEQLRAVHAALSSLPRLEPSAGFTEAVMSRVELPVPWYRRAWSFVREHWLSVAVVTSGAGVVLAGLTYWITSQPDATLGGLLEFGLEQLGAFFWGALLLAAQKLWATGLPDLVGDLVRQVSFWQAVAAMSVMTLTSAAAGTALARLLTEPPVPIHAGRS